MNARRAAEEAQGLVRWLRPEFQNPVRHAARLAQPVQAEIDIGTDTGTDTDINIDTDADADVVATDQAGDTATAAAPAAAGRRAGPADLPAQMRTVADTLAATPGALTETALADRFAGRGPWKRRLPQILQTLEALGRARADGQAGGMAWRSA